VPDAFDGKTLELGGDSPRRQKKMSQDATATPPPEPVETKSEPDPVPVEEKHRIYYPHFSGMGMRGEVIKIWIRRRNLLLSGRHLFRMIRLLGI
jgi:hypothetical protein